MIRSLVWVLAGAVGSALAAEPAAQPIQIPTDEVHWNAAPRSLPALAQMAVLEGDPKQPGLFTMRLRLPAGSRIAPHWHPRHERVTVLEGVVGVGFGDSYEQTRMRLFPAGSYYVNPPNVNHFVGCPQDCTIQVTAEGPWELHYVVQP